VESHAKNLMAAGKWLIISLLLSSSQAMAWGWGNRLEAEDERLLIQAVAIALNNSQNGETVDWYSKYHPANGHVRVVYTYPTGDGFCRVFQAEIVIKGESQYYQERACQQVGAKGWQFYR